MSRYWLYRFILTFLFLMMTVGLKAREEPLPYGLVETPETQEVLDAALAAEAELEGVDYSWYGQNLAHCSGFVSRYLSYLDFTVELVTVSPYDYEPVANSPIPASSTHMQVARFVLFDLELGGGFTQTLTVAEVLGDPNSEDFGQWEDTFGFSVGSLIYWSKAEAQIEYNGWAHVTILLGYNENGQPIFGDFANGMHNGPMLGRTLMQVANGLYWSDDAGEWDLTSANSIDNPGPLRVFVVDVLAMRNASSLA